MALWVQCSRNRYGYRTLDLSVGTALACAGQSDGERTCRGKALPPITTEEKNRMWGLIAVCLISVAFWAAYEQQGNTLALWADTNTDRLILGWEFPASWYQSLNPALVFLLTPVITTLWAWQSKKQREPSAVTKMAVGCFLLASGFLVMVPAAMSYASDGTPVSVLWLFFFTLLAHPWRVIPVSGRSVFGNQALPGSYSVHDDGDLVLVVVHRELCCRISRPLLGEDAEGCLLPHDSGNGLLRGSGDPADSKAPEASHGAERQHVRGHVIS